MIFPLPRKKIKAAWNLVVALVAALVVGLLGNAMGQNVRDAADLVLTMVYQILFGLISMFAAPVVFLTIIAGVCEMGDIGRLKLYGRRVVGAYLAPFAWGFLLCLALPFLFPLNFAGGAASGSVLQSVTEALSGIFPSDIVSPFANGDFAKIVVMAVLLGIGTLVLSQEVPTVLTLINQLNRVVEIVLSDLCVLIPVIIFVTVVQMIWSGELKTVASAWKPVLFIVFWLAVFLVWQVLACRRAINKSVSFIVGAAAPLLVMGLTTASSTACFSMMERTANETLGAEKNISGFAIPIGMMLLVPGEFVEFLTISVYFASKSGIEITAAWLISAIVLSFIFSIAAPPVAGGTAVVMGILLSLLNISPAYVGVAGAVTLLMDYPCTAARVFCISLTSARVSRRIEAPGKTEGSDRLCG